MAEPYQGPIEHHRAISELLSSCAHKTERKKEKGEGIGREWVEEVEEGRRGGGQKNSVKFTIQKNMQLRAHEKALPVTSFAN